MPRKKSKDRKGRFRIQKRSNRPSVAEMPTTTSSNKPEKNKATVLLPYAGKAVLYVATFIFTALIGEKGISMLSGIPPKLVFALVHSVFIAYICWGIWVLTGWLSKYRLFSSIRKRVSIITLVFILMITLPPVYTLINAFVSDLGTIEMEEFGNDSTQVIVHYGERPDDKEVVLTKTTIGQLKDQSQSPLSVNGDDILFIHTDTRRIFVDAVLFGGYKKHSFMNLQLARTQEFSMSHTLYFNTDAQGNIIKEELGGYIADNETVQEIFDAILNEPVLFRGNWLQELPAGWKKYERANAIEVRNEYDIPILVLEYKNPYEITISGLFISSFGIVKIDNDDDITFHFSSNLLDIGTYTINNIFIHNIIDYFVSEKSYILHEDYSKHGFCESIVYNFQKLFKLPTREVKNLVIRPTVFPATDNTPYGLLIEFGNRWDEIDPVNISVNITGTRLDTQYQWWATPNLIDFNWDEVVTFRKGTEAEAFEASARIAPPIYEFYSLGKSISSSNSLYLWYVSPEPMHINSITFQGEKFAGTGDEYELIWERK